MAERLRSLKRSRLDRHPRTAHIQPQTNRRRSLGEFGGIHLGVDTALKIAPEATAIVVGGHPVR